MKTIYQCEVCGSTHDTPEAAAACEALPMQDMRQGAFIDPENVHEPEVGEVVECSYPAKKHWHGNDNWSVYRNRGGRFLDGFYALWVVVAKIPDGDRHTWRYILWSPSDVSGNRCICWTGPNHTKMYPNRVATEEEMANARAMFDSFENKQRIRLL